ncbi:Os04g0251825 [Oryza sativa Japonica Group]|uniref:Os04g0251825 protein n=1 Tax=Oryza sativa subsp. japonica TaxID=39947 RepID=A0A0P0W854_ORYSJ|nr:Os04g0251825 [Oryza sativa Japonica Group]
MDDNADRAPYQQLHQRTCTSIERCLKSMICDIHFSEDQQISNALNLSDYPTHDKATQAALILLTQDIPYCGDPPCNEATGPVRWRQLNRFGSTSDSAEMLLKFCLTP